MPRHKSSQQHQKQQWDLPAGSHVWVYLRHSPGDKQTIDSQAHGMQEWCGVEQWVIDRIFVDEAEEGSKEQRPQFQEMMALARSDGRSVDGIVVWSFSRFARNQLDSQYYKADLRKRGYVVVSKIDDVPNNEIGPIIESVIDWKNQRFLEDLSADVKRGQIYIIEQGFWPNGGVPLGYRLEKFEMGRRSSGEVRYGNRLVKDENVCERVALAWRMKIQDNIGLRKINEITSLYKSHRAFSTFFTNTIYAGIYVHNSKRYPLTWENGERFCEPYITLEEFYQAQSNMAARRIFSVAPRNLSSPYLLSGLLYCGECAANGKVAKLYGGMNTNGRFRHYVCDTKNFKRSACPLPRYQAYRIEQTVIDLLKERVLTTEYIDRVVKQANNMLSESTGSFDNQLKEAASSLKDYQRKIENIVALIADKGTSSFLSKEYDRLYREWEEIVVRQSVLQSHSKKAKADTLSLQEVQSHLDEMLQTIDVGLGEDRRGLVKHFIERIDVTVGKIDIKLKFGFEPITLSTGKQIFMGHEGFPVNGSSVL